MATNPPLPPLNQPGQFGGGPTIGGGLISGAARGVGSLFDPAARAREQRIQILARQEEQERASRTRLQETALRSIGRGRRQPKFAITAQLASARTALKSGQQRLTDVLDPQKQLGITTGLGLKKDQIPQFVAQRRQTVARLSANDAALARIEDSLGILSDDNPTEARFLVSLAGRIRSGELKAGKAELRFEGMDAAGREKQFNEQMTKFINAEMKIINEDRTLSQNAKDTARDIVNVFLLDRHLPEFLEKSARQKVAFTRLEETGQVGKDVATVVRPDTFDELETALAPKLLLNRRESLIRDKSERGTKDRRAFRLGSISAYINAIVESGLELDTGVDSLGFKEPELKDHLRNVLEGRRRPVIRPGKPAFLSKEGAPLTPDMQRLKDSFDNLIQGAEDAQTEIEESEKATGAAERLGLLGRVDQPADVSGLEAPSVIPEVPEAGVDSGLLPPALPEGVEPLPPLPGQEGFAPPPAGAFQLPPLPGQAQAPLGAPQALGQAPPVLDQASINELDKLRERFRPPKVETTVPSQVVRLSEEMLRGQSLSPESREVFAETLGAAFDPEDIDALSDEFGFLNDLEGETLLA